MKLTEIAWPVYLLPSGKPETVEGVLLYHKASKTNETIKIVDDKNIPEATLARRRLRIPRPNLYPLRTALFFVGDIVKIAKGGRWFIDSLGKCFQYTKTRVVPLTFHKIISTTRSPGCTLLELEGIHGRHKSLHPPTDIQKYAGVLKLGLHTYILYGLFDEKHENTRRKI